MAVPRFLNLPGPWERPKVSSRRVSKRVTKRKNPPKKGIRVLGSSEIVVVLAAALLLFGPSKLTEISRSLGKAVAEYQKAAHDFKTEMKKRDFIGKEFEEDAKLMAQLNDFASEMGIDTAQKSKSQIIKEIKDKSTGND